MLNVLNKHPRDGLIVFDETPHIYYINGKPAKTSVTTLVHQYFPKFDSNAIIDRMMNSRWWYKSKYYIEGTANEIRKEEIKELWKQNGMDACTHGTYMHKTIEEYYNQQTLSHPDTVEFNMFLEFANDHKDRIQAYRTEWEVFFEEFDLAGSIDMVFENTADGTFSIYDWKRTKEIKMKNGYNSRGFGIMESYEDCNYVHYSLQLNIYKFILESKYGLKIRDMFLVCMHPDYKAYKKIEVLDLQEEVKAILECRKKELRLQVDEPTIVDTTCLVAETAQP